MRLYLTNKAGKVISFPVTPNFTQESATFIAEENGFADHELFDAKLCFSYKGKDYVFENKPVHNLTGILNLTQRLAFAMTASFLKESRTIEDIKELIATGSFIEKYGMTFEAIDNQFSV